jgi:hypothetical protein
MRTFPISRGAVLAVTLVCAAPLAQAQLPVNAQRVQQIKLRPQRLPATPVLLRVGRPRFELNNKPEVDLREEAKALGVYAVHAQGDRNTCSIFAMSFLLDFMYAKHFNMKNADFSEEFLNLASNLAISEKVDGGFFDAIDLGYQKFGDTSEASAPYKPSFDPNLTYPAGTMSKASALAPRLKPHFIKEWDVNTGLLPSQLLGIIFQLKQGRPVAAGLRWPKQGKFKTETVLGVTMMTAPVAADVVDGHSIAFVGYKVSDSFPGGGYLVFRNSWGAGFMEDGYGYMSFDYAKKYTNDAVEYVLP